MYLDMRPVGRVACAIGSLRGMLSLDTMVLHPDEHTAKIHRIADQSACRYGEIALLYLLASHIEDARVPTTCQAYRGVIVCFDNWGVDLHNHDRPQAECLLVWGRSSAQELAPT